MANITRSTIRPQSLYNLVRMLRSKGYVIVGKEKDPTRYTCIECKLVQTARAALNPNNNLKLAAKKASRNAIQAIKEDKRLLVCPVCGHYRFEGGQDHWGISFDENLLKGISIPTPEPPKKGTPPADVKMCASCGKRPIPEGRKKFCLECRPSQKRPVVY